MIQPSETLGQIEGREQPGCGEPCDRHDGGARQCQHHESERDLPTRVVWQICGHCWVTVGPCDQQLEAV